MDVLITTCAIVGLLIGYCVFLHTKLEQLQRDLDVLSSNTHAQIDWLVAKVAKQEADRIDKEISKKAGAINSLKKITKTTTKRTKQ